MKPVCGLVQLGPAARLPEAFGRVASHSRPQVLGRLEMCRPLSRLVPDGLEAGASDFEWLSRLVGSRAAGLAAGFLRPWRARCAATASCVVCV